MVFGRWWRRREWECWWSGHESISIFWIKSEVAMLGLLGGRNGYIYIYIYIILLFKRFLLFVFLFFFSSKMHLHLYV